MSPSERHPLVSIGMPVRNGQAALRIALRSLLEQSYRDWELLLLDDGSSDRTSHVALEFGDPRIKIYVDGKSRGLPARLNQAISLSKGKYFARMDGDDVSYPERIERQVNYLEAHPEIDLVGTWVLVFGLDGTPLGKRSGPQAHTAICAKPFAGFPIAHPTYVGRLEWFRRYGYNEALHKSQDQDLLLRSYRFSHFSNLPEILLGYREDKIYLKKILTGRWHFARVAAKEFCRRQQPGMAMRAVFEQWLKAVVDCLAVSSGLNYRILRRRAKAITDAERSEWEQVWEQVNIKSTKGLK